MVPVSSSTFASPCALGSTWDYAGARVGRVTPQPLEVRLQAGPYGMPSLNIVGDTHGQLQDVLWIFYKMGVPSPTNHYLVNGDICDRGQLACEIWALFLAFMCVWPDSVHIQRGNHEDDGEPPGGGSALGFKRVYQGFGQTGPKRSGGGAGTLTRLAQVTSDFRRESAPMGPLSTTGRSFWPRAGLVGPGAVGAGPQHRRRYGTSTFHETKPRPECPASPPRTSGMFSRHASIDGVCSTCGPQMHPPRIGC